MMIVATALVFAVCWPVGVGMIMTAILTYLAVLAVTSDKWPWERKRKR